MKLFHRLLPAIALLAGLMPNAALACACGCGVFDVGTGTMMPTGEGGRAWIEYDHMSQKQNRSGMSAAPEDDNEDRRIRSDFYTFGAEYMFSRSWGAIAEIPYVERRVRSADEDSGDLNDIQHAAFGDVKLRGVYSGFSGDMSTGVTFGVKLPTGDYTYPGFERDVQTGTGSVNMLLGAYHMGALDTKGMFNWFANILWDRPFITQDGYRPGTETNAAIGSYYNKGIDLGGAGKLSPLLQLIGSYRLRDGGPNGDPSNSGYRRLLISPGIEYAFKAVKLYGDVEIPVFEDFNGNQLAAPVQFKLVVGYSF
ncbi:MAG: hypothetical protein WDO70_11750 [Alphaproteobacteria bacterium]